MKNKTENNISAEDRERMLAIYDTAPYPRDVSKANKQGIPILEHWINGVLGFSTPVLHAEADILVAGCGSGEEAIVLAQYSPAAKILGVDFSPRSIELARASSKEFPNVKFEVGDLTSLSWNKEKKTFDFILCHAVADYVTNTAALVTNLSACLKPQGIIYLSVNTPNHPAHRIREALGDLGMKAEEFEDTKEQREMLKMAVKLMGPAVALLNLGSASKAHLTIDIFPSISHHYSIDEWEEISQKAGLKLSGSLEAMFGLVHLNDNEIRPLFKLDKPALSKWMLRLREPPGMQLLFSKEGSIEPNFSDLDTLWSWRPLLASCVGVLPELGDDPKQAMHITLRFSDLPDFIIYSTAYDLEVLRKCNGEKCLSEIIADIPVEGDLEALRACLFRAFHYGLLSNGNSALAELVLQL